MKINQSQNVSFKGLISINQLNKLANTATPEAKKMLKSAIGFNATYRSAEKLNPDKLSQEIADKFEIGTDFGNNPFIAAYSALTINIFKKLGWALPSNIYLKDLSKTNYDDALAICCTSSHDRSIFNKFGRNFPLRSIVFNSRVDWEDIQYIEAQMKKVNHSSTGHFLATPIHEFVHNAHFVRLNQNKRIFYKLMKEFEDKDIKALIRKETSNYATTDACELIAEEMSELIVDSLHYKTILPNEMIFKIKRLQEPFMMDKLITAAWNGDYKTIERLRKERKSLFGFLNK